MTTTTLSNRPEPSMRQSVSIKLDSKKFTMKAPIKGRKESWKHFNRRNADYQLAKSRFYQIMRSESEDSVDPDDVSELSIATETESEIEKQPQNEPEKEIQLQNPTLPKQVDVQVMSDVKLQTESDVQLQTPPTVVANTTVLHKLSSSESSEDEFVDFRINPEDHDLPKLFTWKDIFNRGKEKLFGYCAEKLGILKDKSKKALTKATTILLDYSATAILYCSTPLVKFIPDTFFGLPIITPDLHLELSIGLIQSVQLEVQKGSTLVDLNDVNLQPMVQLEGPRVSLSAPLVQPLSLKNLALRPVIKPDQLDDLTNEYYRLVIENELYPAFQYARQVMKNKNPHLLLDVLNQMFLTAILGAVSYLETDVEYRYRDVLVHGPTFDLAYVGICANLNRLYSQFRMTLNYIPTAGERSYWFARMCLPLVISHLNTKEKYQINKENLQDVAVLIILKFLQDNHHVKPIICPIFAINNEQFDEVNTHLTALLTKTMVLYEGQYVGNTGLLLLKTMIFYCLTKYHFHNPVNVTISGEELLFSLYH